MMELLPLVDDGLGNGSYLLVADGEALVVDPWRDPRVYLHEAAERGVRLRWVLETHLHADFISGAGELAARGAQFAAPAGAALDADHRPLADGEELELAGLTIRAMPTPGHTPEHLAYVVADGGEPLAVFSGGALITGGIARTDLLGPDQTVPLARAAYRSLQELLALPDDVPVYPTHGGGSFCSTGAGGGHTTTIGAERAANPLATAGDEDEFVQRLLEGLGSYPPYFLELRDVNRAGPTVHGPTPSLPTLDLGTFDRAVAQDARVIDVRPMEAFAAGHVPGALSIPFRPQFGVWLGWLVDRTTPVAFVADETVDRTDLVWSALTVGFEQVLGELDGGMATWSDADREVSTTPLVAPDAADPTRQVLDVRQRSEWDNGHVPDAIHVELGSLLREAGGLVDVPVLAHCGHGERAMTAASLLERSGHRDVAVLRGGPEELTVERAR